MKRIAILVPFFFFVHVNSLTAQETDEQLWLEASARMEVVDDLDVTLAQMLRLDQGFSRIGKVMPELSVAYGLIKRLKVHGGYRFTADKRSEGDFRFEHRLFVGARYRYPISIFDFNYRLEFQEDIYKKGGEALNDHVLRNRLGFSLDVHKIIVPFLAYELIVNLGGAPGTGLRNWRLTGGVEFDLKDHSIDVFYRLRRDFESPVNTDHIVGLGYRYTF